MGRQPVWAFWRKFETLPSLGIEPRLSILQPFQFVRRTSNERSVRIGGEETEREQLLRPRSVWVDNIKTDLMLGKYDGKVRTGLVWLELGTCGNFL